MTVRTARTAVTAALAAATALALAAPATAAPAHHGGDRGHEATREAIRAQVAAGVPGITIRVTDGDGVWRAAEGKGDLRTGRERGRNDRYRVASVTKTFVATVLLQLEAEGRLDLDDTVHRHLPGLVRGKGHDGRKITLRQLLNHTSGIYNYTSDPGFQRVTFGEGFFEHRFDRWKPEQLVRIAMGHAPDFAPGTGWNYSNTNYILAGLVIEKVTGRAYGTEIERRIIRPLGLRSTSVPGHDHRVPAPAGRAYSKLSDDPAATEIHDVTELNPSAAWAAGEMISDNRDLQRFYRALLTGRLLPPAQQKQLTDTVEVYPGAGYGLGLIRQTLSCGTEIWGHSGGIHGSGTEAVTTRDGRHSVTMNFNADWTGDVGAILEAEYCDVPAGQKQAKAGAFDPAAAAKVRQTLR
jgi:D-alanyl-D-alanine carboxypeptidase